MSAPLPIFRPPAADGGKVARRLRRQVGQAVGRMLAEWERQQPGRSENIFRALTHVSPSQLADRQLFDFNFGATPASFAWPVDGADETATTQA
jgi:tRNA 2-thiocytidine biosynthesis protein TtcA